MSYTFYIFLDIIKTTVLATVVFLVMVAAGLFWEALKLNKR